jgi:dihydrofolate reductase
MKLLLIAAMAKNRVIGYHNRIPWHIPEEIRFFKQSTMGHAIIMGRKTYESIGRPLPGRLNVVLSKDPHCHFPGCQVAADLEAGISCCTEHNKAFIIGGEGLFKEAMDRAHTILLSVLSEDYEGDTFFPDVPAEQFRMVSEQVLVETHPVVMLHKFQRRASTE